MTSTTALGRRLRERWRWWRHTWPFQFAHGPLCHRHRRHVLRIGRLWICRSCFALYAAAIIAVTAALLVPLSISQISTVLLCVTAPVLLLSLPPLYQRLPRGVRDLLRAGAGLLLGLSLACLLLGQWQVGGLMLLGMLLLFFAYSRLRLKHRAAACQTCPELNQGRICSGYRRQAVYIRRYQDEMAVYLEAEIGRDRGWHVPGKD